MVNVWLLATVHEVKHELLLQQKGALVSDPVGWLM